MSWGLLSALDPTPVPTPPAFASTFALGFAGLCASVGALVFVSTSGATEVEPGVRYEGAVRLEFPPVGAAFDLPEGWAGMLPPDGEYFVMESQSFVGYVFAGIEEATVDDARTLMSVPIEVGDGVALHPTGTVAVEESVLTASYAVKGAPVPLVGQIRTIVGAHGWVVAFIGASAPESVEALTSALLSMGQSLTLTAPPVAQTGASSAPGDAGPGTADGASGGPWFEQLNGYKLSYFFTRTGYTEEEYIWLCPDGRFYKTFSSGGFGGGASGAFESENGGRWSVSGPLESGTLLLVFNDGSTSRYHLTLEGTKLFLDGKRYFREGGACG